ncbi:glycoside hydrolase family 18 protein [Mycena galericulata]|nr:glycoside hydrolase family 18 protein [Mycena galericulata]
MNLTVASTTLDPIPSPPTMNSSASGNGTANMKAPYFVIYAMDTVEGEVGPPPVDKIKGFNVVSMAFLLTNGTPAAYSQAAQWQSLSASQRADVKASYAQAGTKLFVSVFGSTETPTTLGIDPNDTATAMAQWVKEYGVDGIDVDYEDYMAMWNGTSEQWVIDFTTQLYNELGGEYLITHAPIAGWFTPPRDELPNGGYRTIDRAVGHMIDWYNIQFYNTPGEDTTCYNMLEKSGTFLSQSSLFEIHNDGQIPLDKIVMGKPATSADADAGYMNATYLNTCVQQASQKNWNGGIMLWKYSSAASKIMQEARKVAFPL